MFYIRTINLLNMKINIHDSTYIFLLISFLSGYFEYIYLLLIIIFIHEMGHFIFSLLCGISVSKIDIYPFGGLSVLNCDLNISIIKEFICLIGGIVFQALFYFFIKFLYVNGFISYHVFNLVFEINVFLISFNFLPIIPLDGGKLLNLFLDLFFSYRLSFKISCFISFIFSFIFLFSIRTILSFLLFLFLIKSIIYEYKFFEFKYNKFLLERYVGGYKFNKSIFIKNDKSFKRGFYHVINNEFEERFLFKKFN